MNRKQALEYVAYFLDDSLSPDHSAADMPKDARLVGWQCGFEPLFVAVWSYLPGVRLAEGEAEDIARDFLTEKHWFSDPDADNVADYVL